MDRRSLSMDQSSDSHNVVMGIVQRRSITALDETIAEALCCDEMDEQEGTTTSDTSGIGSGSSNREEAAEAVGFAAAGGAAATVTDLMTATTTTTTIEAEEGDDEKNGALPPPAARASAASSSVGISLFQQMKNSSGEEEKGRAKNGDPLLLQATSSDDDIEAGIINDSDVAAAPTTTNSTTALLLGLPGAHAITPTATTGGGISTVAIGVDAANEEEEDIDDYSTTELDHTPPRVHVPPHNNLHDSTDISTISLAYLVQEEGQGDRGNDPEGGGGGEASNSTEASSSQPPPQPEETAVVTATAKAVQTLFGMERKQFYVIVLSSLLIVVVLIASTIIGTTTKSTSTSGSPEVCGPLCGSDVPLLPYPDKILFGHTCKDYDLNSTFLPILTSSSGGGIDDSYCKDQYQAVAYGCGCPNIMEVVLPSNNSNIGGGCGSICQAGGSNALPDPELIVMDINGRQMTCYEWDLKSLFDTNDDECVNYNAIGALCGCGTGTSSTTSVDGEDAGDENTPPPDACGPICGGGPDSTATTLPHPEWVVWGQTCQEWDTMSSYLPQWYHNNKDKGSSGDEEATCEEYYWDVAYECGCRNVHLPPNQCDTTLCQERTTCGLLCKDGQSIPDPDRIVRDTTCRAWEFHSRMVPNDQDELCYYYEMIGAECGCLGNEPPQDKPTCGPLCGRGGKSAAGGQQLLPDPTKQIQGQTCQEWDGISTYLYEGYGKAMGAQVSMIESCTDLLRVAYGCGCPDVMPPTEGCGKLCSDGSSVPDPRLVVGDRTCGDLELFSQFETDPDKCANYKDVVASQCGCKSTNEPPAIYDCITMEDLQDLTLYKTIGMSQYMVSFIEDDGKFTQTQNGNSVNLIGNFAGFVVGVHSDNNNTMVASYGGGAPCGMYGPRRGSAVLVEDETVSEPVISHVVEPSICIYEAEVKVPKFC